ncbi:deaminase [Formosa sp. Hel1_33_131]|uniref:RibD family protein n=1 Tax=Formosa sp. Hel1_33_131 TaxID=1336794 RepID=UPI00084E0BA7|nr:RibD family protein [Formosa sp. Hel1_33_131]AOR29235.1 deaminase [Formosa sp. Hel1_33_131]
MNIKKEHWRAILKIKELFPTLRLINQGLKIKNDVVSISEITSTVEKDAVLIVNNKNTYSIKSNPEVDQNLLKALQLYLPFIWIPLGNKLPVVYLHVAQSLDGKIATNSGHSKWIGNMENRIHSHRIRALVDGVMIGGNTLRNDKPKLNVRHVEGKDSVKIVITSEENNYDSLCTNNNSKIICIGPKNDKLKDPKVTYISVEKNNGVLNPSEILMALKTQGIRSILLEGGKETIKHFLKNNLISMMEFHIAPLLFGSGINAIEFDEIKEVSEAIQLNNPEYYPFGNAIMMRSYLNPKF